MFDIGFSELVLIGLLALIVLGPKRLPEAARTAGRWVRTVRGFVASVKQDLAKELQAEDLKEFKRLQEELAEARSALRQSATQLSSELNERIDTGTPATNTKSTIGAAPAPDAGKLPEANAAAGAAPARAAGDDQTAQHGDGESPGNR